MGLMFVFVGDNHPSSDPHGGLEFLVTVWPDGNAELASRAAGSGDMWGPPLKGERRADS